MKKWIVWMLALVMVAAMTGCGNAEQEQGQVAITRATEAAEEAETFSMEYQGLKLIPGASFDPAGLPEAQSVYQVPSCAIEGTDNVYSYGGLELTAFDDGSGEMIYSVYLMDATVSTDEGLTVGDKEERITEVYGEDNQGTGNEYVYVRGDSELHILVQDGLVLSIEFRKGN